MGIHNYRGSVPSLADMDKFSDETSEQVGCDTACSAVSLMHRVVFISRYYVRPESMASVPVICAGTDKCKIVQLAGLL